MTLRISILALALLAGCGFPTATLAPEVRSEAALNNVPLVARGSLRTLFSPGLPALANLTGILSQTAEGLTPGALAGSLERHGDTFTFKGWSAQMEIVDGSVRLSGQSLSFTPGFRYRSLDGRVDDVVAGGSIEGGTPFQVETLDNIRQIRKPVGNLSPPSVLSGLVT